MEFENLIYLLALSVVRSFGSHGDDQLVYVETQYFSAVQPKMLPMPNSDPCYMLTIYTLWWYFMMKLTDPVVHSTNDLSI